MTTQANQNQTKPKIPKLRFGEFRENWEEKKLGEVGKFQTSSVDKLSKEKEKQIYLVNYMNVYRHENFNNSSRDKLQIVTAKNNQITTSDLKKGDILFTPSSETSTDIGHSVVIFEDLENTLFSYHLMRFRPKIKLDLLYSHYFCNIPNVLKQLSSFATGSTRFTISVGNFSKVKINLPSIKEQEKIAKFLSKVDEEIENLKSQKETLEKHKRGLMQKIFSRKIRFTDEGGSEFADWEEKRLGEVGKFQTSSVDKLSKEKEKQIYLVNYMNVYRHENFNNSSRDKLQIVTAKNNQITTSDLKKGDILFTPSSETSTDIGHSVVIFEDLENTLFSYHLMRFRPKIKLDLLYSHYFCNIPNVLKQLSSFATGSTRFTISVGNFSKVKINLPSIKEQKKIANFLSKIDETIECKQTEISTAEKWKKGLMGRMFC